MNCRGFPLCLALSFSFGAIAGCNNDSISSYQAPVAASAGSGMGAMPGANMRGPLPPGSMPQVMPTDSASSRGDVKWTLPEGWREVPPSEMRLASFSAEGKDGLKADISVVVLSGQAGGELANVNRWREQINLDPIGQDELPSHSERISTGGRRMLLVDFVSKDAFIDNRYKKRLVAAIYPREDKVWFFKMTGEDGLVRSVKPAFVRFLETLQFRGKPANG